MLQKISIILLGSALVWASPTWAATKIGSVVAVVGAASASGPEGSRNLGKGSNVFEDDTIKVGTGNAQIMLDDGTRIVVGPASSLLLDQFVMRGNSKAEKVSLKALRGTYRFITGRSAKSAYKITTAHATIGVRGTGFDFWSRGRTGAAVLSGKVSLAARSGSRIDINSGCQMGIATNAAADLVRGSAKTEAIRANLPFILDQSSLTRRFRLNVVTCRLVAPDSESGGDSSPAERNNRRRNPNGG